MEEIQSAIFISFKICVALFIIAIVWLIVWSIVDNIKYREINKREAKELDLRQRKLENDYLNKIRGK